MNYHELLDRLTVGVGSRAVLGNRFFANSVESPILPDAVANSDAAFDGLDRTGVTHETVSTPVGDLPFAYLVWNWEGPDAPTLVYHHGNGEDPFDFGRLSTHTFKTIFDGHRATFPANVVAVRAPFHDLSTRAFTRRMGDLSNFTAMLAGSVAGIDELVRTLAADDAGPTVVAGFSLGGWVANLHRAFRGTASAYAPMFAGAALGDLFLTSRYRQMAARSARDRPEHLRDVLDFEAEFRRARAGDVFALLGRYDQFVEYDRQRRCYDDSDLATVERGHVTGSLAGDRLRDHLARAVASV